MGHIGTLIDEATFSDSKVLYNALGTSDGTVYVKGQELSPINALKHYKYACDECVNRNCIATSEYDKGDIVGAHVVKSKPKREISEGDICYIIPLCRSCNSSNNRIVLDKAVRALQIEWHD